MARAYAERIMLEMPLYILSHCVLTVVHHAMCLLWSIMQCGQQKMASRKYSKAWQGRITACVFSYGDKIIVTVGKSSTHTESLRIKMLPIATSVLYQECVKWCMHVLYLCATEVKLTTHVHVRLLVIGIL